MGRKKSINLQTQINGQTVKLNIKTKTNGEWYGRLYSPNGLDEDNIYDTEFGTIKIIYKLNPTNYLFYGLGINIFTMNK